MTHDKVDPDHERNIHLWVRRCILQGASVCTCTPSQYTLWVYLLMYMSTHQSPARLSDARSGTFFIDLYRCIDKYVKARFRHHRWELLSFWFIMLHVRISSCVMFTWHLDCFTMCNIGRCTILRCVTAIDDSPTFCLLKHSPRCMLTCYPQLQFDVYVSHLSM